VSSGDPCGGAAEPVCDETNDVCVECLTNADCTAPDTCVDNVCTPPAPECTTDADCEDDGLFCNGAEFCNTSGVPAVCASEGDPCEEGQTCDEDADACTLPGEGFVLTSDDDAITGTTGDDTFTASVGTLNPDDIIVGSGGNDTLNANIAGSTSSLATLIDIDTVNFTTLNNATFDLANSAAIGLISVTGTGNLTLDNAEGDTAYQMGAGYAERLRVTLDDDSAADDEMDLTVAGTAEGASFDYLQDADAVETLNVMVTADSDLSPADPGTDLFGDVDEALITGTGALTLSGVDPVDLAANAPDTTDFEGTLTVAPAADAGHTFNFTAGGLANLEGIDAYVITDTMTFNHSITLNDSPVSVDISLIDEDDSAGNVTVVQSTANDDELNLTLGGDGDGMGALTAATSEFINIVSGGTTANAIANVTGESGTAFVTETVTVTGDQDIDLGTVTSEMLDATGLTGALTMTAAASMAIDGGSGDDDITGSAAVDLIDAGAGNDTITGDDGDDDLTGGDGDNTFVYVSVFESGGNDDDGDDNIADFDAGDAIELDDSNAFADGTADLTNTGVCTDDSIDIDNDGTDTTILIDTDTDGAAVNCVTIVLEGVTFDDTDFTFDADTELLTLVE
jgi:hypothetical protein